MTSGQNTPPAPRHVLWLLIVVCCGIEAVLILADHRLIGTPLWRSLAYQNGGFWAGLLHGWQPNYAAQPALMFITHAFLHAGIGHLAGNMLGVFWLGQYAIDRIGARRFAGLYLTGIFGGAAGFGLLAGNPAPMVGASGAIFGLAGAAAFWLWRDRRGHGLRGWQAVWPMLAAMAGLAGLNLASWAMMAGQLAWEAHLGGAVAGWLLAAILAPAIKPPTVRE